MTKDETPPLALEARIIAALTEEARASGAADFIVEMLTNKVAAAEKEGAELQKKLLQRTTENESLTAVLEAKNAELDTKSKSLNELHTVGLMMISHVARLDVLHRDSPRGAIGEKTHSFVRLATLATRFKAVKIEDEIPF